MSWASRRRTLYTLGTILFFGLLFGLPAFYWYANLPETCTDGVQNGDETAVDKGGSCPLLDERLLSPHAILWTREFTVRDGTYNVVAYVENPNEGAGVVQAPYRFKLYDARNSLVAERDGSTYLMPGTVTPIFEGSIDTGNRSVARAYLEFTAPLVWVRMSDAARSIQIESKSVDSANDSPRLVAIVRNTSVVDILDVEFVATLFDTAGNAFAGSSTVVPRLKEGERMEIVFTWPERFLYVPGRIDVVPSVRPHERN
jgi:hypothetical protein